VFYLADLITGYLAAAGMMAALLRRSTEGGSYHVKLSLARSSMWVHELGLVATEKMAGLPTTDTYPANLTTFDTTFGPLTQLAPALKFSDLTVPPPATLVPYGADPPRWFPN
jgi:crotonobetainyl-CoA:carnitine CoA-transferase CaiB-like acyl-CoA transferase